MLKNHRYHATGVERALASDHRWFLTNTPGLCPGWDFLFIIAGAKDFVGRSERQQTHCGIYF